MGFYEMQFDESKKIEIIAVANAMLNGEMHLVEGLREINSLRLDYGDDDNKVFYPIIGYTPDFDRFVLGKPRLNCTIKHLQEMDEEMEALLSAYKPYILDACKEIVRVLS